MQSGPTVMLVVAAMIRDGAGRILMQQRPDGKAHAGLWEFPGGKVEPHENPKDSLVREIEEELGLHLLAADLEPVAFAESAGNPGERAIVILLYSVRWWRGEPEAREGGDLAWIEPSEINHLPMPPLDVELVERLWHEKG